MPATTASSKLVKIYSNLGKGSNVYNSIAGVGILGPDGGQPWPQWMGCGFRPKADHTVTEIQVGATYVQGTNTLVVSLNEDNKGSRENRFIPGIFPTCRRLGAVARCRPRNTPRGFR